MTPCPYATRVYPITGTALPHPITPSSHPQFNISIHPPSLTFSQHTEITRRLLLHSRLDVERLAALVAYDCSYVTWTNMMANEVIRFEALGWRLSEPLSLIRAGERELEKVCRGLDRNSAAVAEVMLRRVGDLETRCGIAPLDGKDDNNNNNNNDDHAPPDSSGRGNGNRGRGSHSSSTVFSSTSGQGGSGGRNGSSPGVPNNSSSPHY